MARNKPHAKKKRLIAASKSSKPVPTWVMMKTMGKVRSTPTSYRHWRRGRLKL